LRATGFIPFSSAHNLFIDLVVWCGIPLGGLLCVAIVVWVVRRFLAVKRPDQAVLMLLVLVVLNHSMLEFPLLYTYLLLPMGWLVGAMEVRGGSDPRRWFKVPRAAVLVLYLGATTLMVLIINDYLHLEPGYQNMKLERKHIQIAPWTTPDALVLTHMSRLIAITRFAPTKEISEAELLERENLTEALRDGYAIFYLAEAEALSHRPEKAVLWLQRYCKLMPANGCGFASENWAQSSRDHPEIAAIAWPYEMVKVTKDNAP